MGQKHELERQVLDMQQDTLLTSQQGRIQYWDDLKLQGEKESIISLLRSVLHLPGDVIECGVYRGGSLFKMARELADQGVDKTIFACDSFEGFPSDKVGKADQSFLRPVSKLRSKFKLADDVPDRIERFSEYYNVPIEVLKGFFSETLSSVSARTFCFIHLDVDLYESYKECLTILFPRLVPGGIVVFDDYRKSAWPGAQKAVDEFFANRPEKVVKSTAKEAPAWYVQKAYNPAFETSSSI